LEADLRPHAFLVLSTLVCLAAPAMPAQSTETPTTATTSDAIDPPTITFTPADEGSQQVKLTLAVWTFGL